MSNGYNLDMGTLLTAMKQSLVETTSLSYLNDVRIVNGPWMADPWNQYTVYLRPGGSPETLVAESGARGICKYAVHVVVVEVVMRIENPFDEDSVVGRTDERVGITSFVADLCEFLENNTLGLLSTELEENVPPTIEFPDGAYQGQIADDDIWIQSARGIYRARTRPFYRTGTFT